MINLAESNAADYRISEQPSSYNDTAPMAWAVVDHWGFRVAQFNTWDDANLFRAAKIAQAQHG